MIHEYLLFSKSRLIVGEVKCVFWTSMFVAIIYIEDKLFIHGRSVFGLFSAVCLFMACLQIYFWILVLVILISIYLIIYLIVLKSDIFVGISQSLYCKYDQEEMSKEEYFKLHYGGDRIQGSGWKQYIEEWLQCSIGTWV